MRRPGGGCLDSSPWAGVSIAKIRNIGCELSVVSVESNLSRHPATSGGTTRRETHMILIEGCDDHAPTHRLSAALYLADPRLVQVLADADPQWTAAAAAR